MFIPVGALLLTYDAWTHQADTTILASQDFDLQIVVVAAYIIVVSGIGPSIGFFTIVEADP